MRTMTIRVISSDDLERLKTGQLLNIAGFDMLGLEQKYHATNPNGYNCKYCNEHFINRWKLGVHVRNAHKRKNKAA